jgi:hypothetical protein
MLNENIFFHVKYHGLEKIHKEGKEECQEVLFFFFFQLNLIQNLIKKKRFNNKE